MHYSYDREADALYVQLGEGRPERQVRLSDGTIIDLGSDDSVVGVEVLVPSSLWDATLGARFVLDPTESEFLSQVALLFLRDPKIQASAGGSEDNAGRLLTAA